MSTRWRHTLGACCALALAASALAADDNKIIFPAGGTGSGAPAAPAGGSLNTITLVLGLALAGVGGWFVWRNRRGTPRGHDVRSLAIEETRSLGNRQYLVVASYEGKKFLLGVCAGQISLLSALPGSADEKDPRP
jgi:flagellar protein FliO/FliZ